MDNQASHFLISLIIGTRPDVGSNCFSNFSNSKQLEKLENLRPYLF